MVTNDGQKSPTKTKAPIEIKKQVRINGGQPEAVHNTAPIKNANVFVAGKENKYTSQTALDERSRRIAEAYRIIAEAQAEQECDLKQQTSLMEKDNSMRNQQKLRAPSKMCH